MFVSQHFGAWHKLFSEVHTHSAVELCVARLSSRSMVSTIRRTNRDRVMATFNEVTDTLRRIIILIMQCLSVNHNIVDSVVQGKFAERSIPTAHSLLPPTLCRPDA